MVCRGAKTAMREREEYRIAALDMDGTLLNSDHRITPYTREVLTRVAESGKVVALSTGRTLSELWPYLNDMPFVTYVIGENGACLYDVRSGRMLRRYVIEDAEVDFVLELSERYDAVCQAFMEDQSYIRGALDGTLARYHVLDFIDTFRSGSIVVDDMRAVCRTKRGTVSKINLYFSGEDERADYLRRVAGTRSLVEYLVDDVGRKFLQYVDLIIEVHLVHDERDFLYLSHWELCCDWTLCGYFQWQEFY